MNNTIVKEGTDILKRLSPKNQSYFMTLLRLAEVAENGAKDEMINQFYKPPSSVGQQATKLPELAKAGAGK